MDGEWRAPILTVEHGGNRVPTQYDTLFQGRGALLDSHRGWDPGTLALGHELAEALQAPTVTSTVTRLLVDLNRSAGNPAVFSEVTRPLPPEVRRHLITRYHRPHHEEVRSLIRSTLEAGLPVLHLGIHSFTPVLDGRVRGADVALLYDPGRSGEAAFAARVTRTLGRLLPGWRVRRNYPYRGTADGLVTILRRQLPQEDYLGIELEVNQAHLMADGRFPGGLTAALVEAIAGGGLHGGRPDSSVS